MGANQSNNLSSEVDTLNWSDVNTEAMTEGYRVKKNKNGIKIIDIDFEFNNNLGVPIPLQARITIFALHWHSFPFLLI